MPEVAELRVGDQVLVRTWGGDVGWTVVMSANEGYPAEISHPAVADGEPAGTKARTIAPLEWITPLADGRWALNIPPSY